MENFDTSKFEKQETTKSLENPENAHKEWEKQAKKYKYLVNEHKNLEQNKWSEAYLEMELKLGEKTNFVDIIENEKEFEIMYSYMWDILKANWTDISQEEINVIRENWPKNLQQELLLLYWENPKKFKDMYTILDSVNRNWLMNFFSKETISFENKIKDLKDKLNKEFSHVKHIPDTERKFLDTVKKYYGEKL